MFEPEDHDDGRMAWEINADAAIERLIDDAEFDDIAGTVILRRMLGDGRHCGVECSTLEELEDELRDAYSEGWYSCVPIDEGAAVFDDDPWDAVEESLSRDTRFVEFFEQHSAPSGTETIVKAGELILDHSASRMIRVTIEEINDELVSCLAANPHLMRDMKPRKFEELVAAMFRNQGFDVTLTPRSCDGGVDVIAIQKGFIGTAMVLIECKRYSESNKVGVEIVRGLYGVVEKRQASLGIVATTSYFTRGATEFCQEIPYRLDLADFDVLSAKLNDWKKRIAEDRSR